MFKTSRGRINNSLVVVPSQQAAFSLDSDVLRHDGNQIEAQQSRRILDQLRALKYRPPNTVNIAHFSLPALAGKFLS